MGRHIRLRTAFDDPSYEVIGVARDAKYNDLRDPVPAMFYLPLTAIAQNGVALVRGTNAGAGLAAAIGGVVRSVDPRVRVATRTMEEVVSGGVQPERLMARSGAFFGTVALVLACIGLYGVLAFGLAQRTPEIGVRLALGAQRGDVLGAVLRQGAFVAAVGLGIGLCGALASGRFITALLYGVSARDPVALAGAGAVLLLVALMASWLPARRAAGVDPMTALRRD